MWMLIVEYCLIGIAAGLLSGLLGVGGGLIVVPALAWIFADAAVMPNDILMHMVVGTSLAAMILTTLFSAHAHMRRGVAIWPVFKRLFLGIIIGTILGTLLAGLLHTGVLKILFGVFVLIIALRSFFPEQSSKRQTLPGPLGRWLSTLFIGICSGLLGIGGSTLLIPYLTYFNVPMREAMAVSTACGLVVSITGTIAFMIVGLQQGNTPAWSTGYIYWPAVIGIGLMTPLFATLGVILSHRLPIKILRYIFTVFLLLVALQMLIH